MPLLKSTSTTIYSPVQTYVYSRTLRTCLFIDLKHSLSLSLRDFFFVVVLLRGGVLIFLRLVKLHHHHRWRFYFFFFFFLSPREITINTVRCRHQVQDCCRLREWYVCKLFLLFFLPRWFEVVLFTAALNKRTKKEREQKQYSARARARKTLDWRHIYFALRY